MLVLSKCFFSRRMYLSTIYLALNSKKLWRTRNLEGFVVLHIILRATLSVMVRVTSSTM